MTSPLLDRAQAGDEHAFRELTEPYVRELHVHCYRMLGSLTDTEDLLQETLTAAWRGLDAFAGRSSLRTWLYRIATNRCLNAIRDARRRPVVEPVPPFQPPEPSRRGEVTWLHPYPDAWLEQVDDHRRGPAARYDARVTVELAFIAALQRLPHRQAAVLILTDVLGFGGTEVAEMIDGSPTSVKGLLQRARASMATRDVPGHTPAGGPGSPAERELAARFARAYTDGDVDGVVALLTHDAWLAMPPAPHEYVGRAAVASFLRASARWRGPRRVRLVPTRANGQPAFGCYHDGPEDHASYPVGVIVLAMTDDRISGIIRFLDSDLLRRFALTGARH